MATEIERKFTMDPAAAVPDLGEVAELGQLRRFELDATYFDTPDLRLARNRLTLRRRTGGNDEGWHLKTPGDGHAREEIHADLTASSSPLQVPQELRVRIVDLLSDAPLVPVATLQTERRECDLTTDGRLVAVLCDDTVTATRAGQSRTWRELEVELTGEGTVDDLERITAALAERGITPSKSVSKLVQALGEQLAGPELQLGRKSSGAAVAGAYLATQIGLFQSRVAAARDGDLNQLHDLRQAVRRLMGTLRTFRPLLDTDRTERIRGELQWLDSEFTELRAARAVRRRMVKRFDALDKDLPLGTAKSVATTALEAQINATLVRSAEAIHAERTVALADDLVRLITDSPFTGYADARAKGLLPPLLERSIKRSRRQLQAAMASGDAAEIEAARTKVRFTRYAWEAVAPVIEGADGAADAWHEVSDLLGTLALSTASRAALRTLTENPETDAEARFVFGALWERERAEAEQALQRAREVERAARRASEI